MIRILRSSALLVFSLSIVLAPAFTIPVGAQTDPGSTTSEDLKTLTLEDYGRWSTIGQVSLSGDGRWMTFSYAPNEGDAELFLRGLDRLDSDPDLLSVNGTGPVFSDDSRWLAYISTPAEEEGARGRGGPPGEESGSAAGSGRGGRTRTLHLRDLASGEEWTMENPSSFSFSDDSRWLAVHKGGSGGGGGAARGPGGGARSGAGAGQEAETARGADLILRNLQNGEVTNLGNVAEVAFNEGSTHLAYVVDAEGRNGNGLFAMELATGRILPLSTGKLLYQGLSWDEAGTALAVLRGETPEGETQRVNQLVTVTDLGGTAGSTSSMPASSVYDPSMDPAFPEGFVVSEFRSPDWSEDGARVFVGIKEQAPDLEEDQELEADVMVWHWKDRRVQSQQEVQAGRDRRSTYLAAVNLDGPRFVRLATEDMDQVQVTSDGRWALGFDDSPYWRDREHQDNRSDVYRLDPSNGERTLVTEALIRSMGTSPDSRWFLFWQDKRVQAYELATGEITDLTARAGPVDFENHQFDQPVEPPTYGVGGWSTDGEWVFLNTRFDIWKVGLNRDESHNVTFSQGDSEQIQFRIMDLNPEDEGVDLSEPLLLTGYGERTKKSGYFRAREDGAPEPLLWEDAMLGTAGFRGSGIRKAENADRVLFTRQTFVDFPDYWVSDTDFRNPVQVTEANPQQAEYRWGRRVLVDYTDQRGHDLQATLTLPAGYQEGSRYPMIIYFYEKMSQRHHEYSRPVYDDRPHMSTYASDGYLVLMPDIVYDMGYPGSSALDDVVSAAEAAIDQGYADPDRICLQGHSWGGYETSFILTQTDQFTCIVTGAPLTNLVSMHNILYKSSGSPNASIIEWGQGRMDTTPFQDFDRYVAESPIHHIEDVSTPFLILQGTADGAVDWNQGLELYIAARRMGKEVIFLSYPDEPHHLSREENQKDFQIRMKQFFDHYLKDAPAPPWMEEGVPFLERNRVDTRGGGGPGEQGGGGPG